MHGSNFIEQQTLHVAIEITKMLIAVKKINLLCHLL